MNEKALMTEMILRTGEWNIPEYTKILESCVTASNRHQFKVLFYTHGIGETIIEITMKELEQ